MHLRIGPDVDRTARGNISSRHPPPRGGRNALDTKVAAVGEGPAGEARFRDFRVLGVTRSDGSSDH